VRRTDAPMRKLCVHERSWCIERLHLVRESAGRGTRGRCGWLLPEAARSFATRAPLLAVVATRPVMRRQRSVASEPDASAAAGIRGREALVVERGAVAVSARKQWPREQCHVKGKLRVDVKEPLVQRRPTVAIVAVQPVQDDEPALAVSNGCRDGRPNSAHDESSLPRSAVIGMYDAVAATALDRTLDTASQEGIRSR
jgi:hypothetical protein